MEQNVAAAVCAVFVVLACWHLYMALVPPSGTGGALPVVDGKPLFTPSRGATLIVALALLGMGLLVVATAGVLQSGLSQTMLDWLCWALAAGLLARAIGDFNYLGLFKRVRGSRFATLDTFLFSPLCLLLAVGVALVARH